VTDTPHDRRPDRRDPSPAEGSPPTRVTSTLR